jgi:hypothetical protein
VLGIDSCKMSPDASPAARDYARSLMVVGSTVTLTREPGVDTDQNDRASRYGALAGGLAADNRVSDGARRHVGATAPGCRLTASPAGPVDVALATQRRSAIGPGRASPVPAVTI